MNTVSESDDETKVNYQEPLKLESHILTHNDDDSDFNHAENIFTDYNFGYLYGLEEINSLDPVECSQIGSIEVPKNWSEEAVQTVTENFPFLKPVLIYDLAASQARSKDMRPRVFDAKTGQ